MNEYLEDSGDELYLLLKIVIIKVIIIFQVLTSRLGWLDLNCVHYHSGS